MQSRAQMTFFEFCANLREEVLEQISGVKNSNGYLSWDNTTPNSIIKHRLESMLDKYVTQAKEFGIYVVTRYSSCSNVSHDGYPTENRYGISIAYQDSNFIWSGDQLYQGSRNSTCPCSKSNKPSSNHVIDDIIFDKTANLEKCRELSHALQDVSESIQHAGNNRSRSGIREHLLRAVLRLNDTILPQSVSEYITIIRRDNA